MAEYNYTNHPRKRKPNGRRQSVTVHRLLWEETYGDIPEGMIIHHKNEDKKDNRIENLQMVSKSQHTLIHKKHSKAETPKF